MIATEDLARRETLLKLLQSGDTHFWTRLDTMSTTVACGISVPVSGPDAHKLAIVVDKREDTTCGYCLAVVTHWGDK